MRINCTMMSTLASLAILTACGDLDTRQTTQATTTTATTNQNEATTGRPATKEKPQGNPQRIQRENDQNPACETTKALACHDGWAVLGIQVEDPDALDIQYVNLTVRNTGDVPDSGLFTVDFYEGDGSFIASATGAVNDLVGGRTKTAKLILDSRVRDYNYATFATSL